MHPTPPQHYFPNNQAQNPGNSHLYGAGGYGQPGGPGYGPPPTVAGGYGQPGGPGYGPPPAGFGGGGVSGPAFAGYRRPPPGAPAFLWVMTGFLMFWSASCNATGCAMALDDNGPPMGSVAMMFIFGVLIFAGGAAIGFSAWGKRKKTRRLMTLVGLMNASSQVPMQALEADLGLKGPAVRAFVLDAIAEGYVQGRLDLEHGTLLSAQVDATIQQVSAQCTHCGAQNIVHRRPGQAVACPQCRAPLHV
jgi:hypothetical protein